MDNDIRLVKIDSKNGIGKFIESNKAVGQPDRVIEIPLKNLVSTGYECSNLECLKDGRFIWGNNEYVSLGALLNGKATPKRKAKAVGVSEDVRALVNSMKLMSGTTAGAKVREIDDYDGLNNTAYKLYIQVDNDNNVIIAVPEQNRMITSLGEKLTGFRRDESKGFNEITLIGGGKNLTSLSGTFSMLNCKKINLDNLCIENVVSTNEAFLKANIEQLDLSWTHRCKIKRMRQMFKGYLGKVIPLYQLRMDDVEDMSTMFTWTEAAIDFSGMKKIAMPNLWTTENMFSRYNNKKQHLWLNWLDMSNVKDANSMFYETTCNRIDISDWDVRNVKYAIGMFEHVNTAVIGLNDAEHKHGGLQWDSLEEAGRMISNLVWNGVVTLHAKNKTLYKVDRMFVNAKIAKLDVSDVIMDLVHLRLKAHAFSNMQGTLKLTAEQYQEFRGTIDRKKVNVQIVQ